MANRGQTATRKQTNKGESKPNSEAAKSSARGKGKGSGQSASQGSGNGSGVSDGADRANAQPGLKWPDKPSEDSTKLAVSVLELVIVNPVGALQLCAKVPKEVLLETVYFQYPAMCHKDAGCDWLAKLTVQQLAVTLVGFAVSWADGYARCAIDVGTGAENYIASVQQKHRMGRPNQGRPQRRPQ